jgi:tyrosinase
MEMTFAHFERLAREQSQQSVPLDHLLDFANKVSQGFVDPSITNMLNHAMARPRKNHQNLTQSEKNAFNNAVQAAEADGSYSRIALIHHDMSHRMHSIMGGGYIGGMRFLPWHRVYLSILESQLQIYDPNVLIPYWDWANDHTLPPWVYLPAGVTRAPGPSTDLPDQSAIDTNVLSQTDYPHFTLNGELNFRTNPPGLEQYHNMVHNWIGGTMQDPMSSPADPMFWLHHANVDRIWAQWHDKYPNILPPLSGVDAAMDPWSWLDTMDANDTYNFRYFYT